jgi:O-glycosyl hydrolase
MLASFRWITLAATLSITLPSLAQLTPDGVRSQEATQHSGVQPAVTLPSWDGPSATTPNATPFQFVTDGPRGGGWGHADEVARVFLEPRLPAFFTRTLVLADQIPAGGTLNWIFTGQQGGFTVELSHDSVHIIQRFYDSYGLRTPGSRLTYPQAIVDDVTIPFHGDAKAITVDFDSHLKLRVKINGLQVAEQTCLMDMQRDQLQFVGLRTTHAVVSGAILPTASATTTVHIDPAQKFQTMLGFGGSPSISAYDSLSPQGKKLYWQMLQRYNLLIDREYPMGTELKPDMSNLDNIADSTPHYYGDNFPNSEVTSFTYNAMSLKIGGKVIYELWALPTWATKDYTDPEGKLHKGAANVQEWARAMLTYTRMEKQRTGKAPDILGIENEVIQPKEITLQMVTALRSELDKAGFKSVKIHMPDASTVPPAIAQARILRADPAVWSKIDYATAHQYDYQRDFTDPDAFDARLTELRAAIGDKPFLTTELCLNSPLYQIASYRVAFQMAQLYHKNLTILDSVGILYCWLILDAEQPNFPASRALIAVDRTHGDLPIPSSFQLRALGAFSRHIREGMVRIQATSSKPDLLVTAYTDAKGGKTLVALNRSMLPQTLDLSGDGAWTTSPGTHLERVSLYDENIATPTSGPITVQPGEIVTLSSVPQPTVTP